MPPFRLHTFATPDALAAEAANRWAALLPGKEAISPSHRSPDRAPIPPFSVALSGGRISQTFFRAVTARFAQIRPLDAIHFFWADERVVPPEHPESNFLMARQCLFEPLGIQPAQIHRVQGELDPAAAARAAEEDARNSLPLNERHLPVFDLVFLGMGEDGHTASLFPGQAAPADRVYFPVVGPKPPPDRVTLTYAAIASARRVWVLISGTGKEAALRAAVESAANPLGRVLEEHPQAEIFTDFTLS